LFTGTVPANGFGCFFDGNQRFCRRVCGVDSADGVSLQVVLWLLLSTALVFLSRRFLPHPRASKNLDAMEAQTLTEIAPGQTGRVLYEGNSWRARCEDHTEAIAPNQKVYVVRREGTTLIVVPQNLLH
jgi:membrane protein implicated in regulation of membrane protease activity